MVGPHFSKKMIACLVDDLSKETLIVTGEGFVHLNLSLRVRLGDIVLALDGKGFYRETLVVGISKKEIILEGGEIKEKQRTFILDLLLSPPKREALNDCLRMSCELGFRTIYLFNTEYTQNKKIDIPRIQKILRSACVQSNNKYLPHLVLLENLNDLKPSYEKSFIFHLSKEEEREKKLLLNDIKNEFLMVIGPEGGFSPVDINIFKKELKNYEEFTLDFPILRTPTALCVASGWLIGHCKV